MQANGGTAVIHHKNIYKNSKVWREGALVWNGRVVRYYRVFTSPIIRCFLVCLYSRSSTLHADWRKSDSSVDGERQENWRRNSNSKGVIVSPTSFFRPAARAPRRAFSPANGGTTFIHQESIYKNSEGWGQGKWLRSKILLSFYITNYSLFFFVVMHLFASFRIK